MFVVKKFFSIGIIALSLFLISCAANSSQMATSNYSPSSNTDYVYVGTDDNEAGAKTIANYLEKIGYDVISSSNGVIKFQIPNKDIKFIADVKLSEDLDRLIFFKFFSVKDQYKGTAQAEEIALALNKELNIGTFYIDKDGDFVYQTQLTFNNYLYKNEIEGFTKWYLFSIIGTVFKKPELLEILE